MDLAELAKKRERLGEVDPLWAILTAPQIGNKWGVEEFFKTGVHEIEEILRHIDSLGFPLKRRNALDFGCGVGRLTQAMAMHFSQCCGIDSACSGFLHTRRELPFPESTRFRILARRRGLAYES